MRILWLYKYFPLCNTDHWLHMDFARYINTVAGVKLQAYGPGLHELYSDITPTIWDKNITMKDLKKIFDFDVVICNTKSRMFTDYLPMLHPNNLQKKTIAKDCWLPQDFDTFDCPKVMLEEDYHYELNDDWYYNRGIQLIIQRHKSNSLRIDKVKQVWHPFSVNTKIFKPNLIGEKINKIHFLGALTEVYIHRRTTIQILKANGYLEDYIMGKLVKNDDYITALQKYTTYLSGSSLYYITPAKMFEIMACGGILVTNNQGSDISDDYGLNELFPANSIITYNNLNYGDLLDKVNNILTNKQLQERIRNQSLKVIKEKHTHDIRIIEIINTIKKEFKI